MCNDRSGGDRVDGADGAEGKTAERKSMWPEEGSACQETNKHPAPRGWMRLIGRACRPPSLPRLLRLFMNFTILTLFFPFSPLHSPSSPPRQASGPPSHRARRRALTRRSALLRRLLNISIKFCLSARPDDLPWRAREERRALHGEPWNGYCTQSCISEELAWR